MTHLLSALRATLNIRRMAIAVAVLAVAATGVELVQRAVAVERDVDLLYRNDRYLNARVEILERRRCR